MDSMFQNSLDNQPVNQVQPSSGRNESYTQPENDTKVLDLNPKLTQEKGFSPSSGMVMSNANVYKSHETDSSLPLMTTE